MTQMSCLLILVVLVHLSVSQQISDNCLGCLCQASTGCKKDQGCTETACGPFQITWAFWADGGKYLIKGRKVTDNDAYSSCTQDMYCASETVRGYMQRYAKDCNNDGAITCDDYGRIHRLGPNACEDPNVVKSEFYQEFSKCLAQVKE